MKEKYFKDKESCRFDPVKYYEQYRYQTRWINGKSTQPSAEHLEECRQWELSTLQNAKNPKVIDVEETKSNKIKTSLHFEVVILFDATTINKPYTMYGRFEPKNHSFKIFRWNPNAIIEDFWESIFEYNSKLECGVQVPKKIFKYPNGGYYVWLEHKRSRPTKWNKLNENSKIHYSYRDRVIRGDLFFKTEEDFKNWMGEEHYASMFTDLLG